MRNLSGKKRKQNHYLASFITTLELERIVIYYDNKGSAV